MPCLDFLKAFRELLVVGMDLRRPGNVACRGVIAVADATGILRSAPFALRADYAGQRNALLLERHPIPACRWLAEGELAIERRVMRRAGQRPFGREQNASQPRRFSNEIKQQKASALSRLLAQRFLDVNRELGGREVHELLKAGRGERREEDVISE